MFSLIHFFKKKIIMPVISIIISKYLYHPQQKTRTRTTTKKWQKTIFHDHEKKERKNIDYVHVLEDVPIWWHDILLVIGIFAQQAINKDIISLFFWKTHGPFLLVVVMAIAQSNCTNYFSFEKWGRFADLKKTGSKIWGAKSRVQKTGSMLFKKRKGQAVSSLFE